MRYQGDLSTVCGYYCILYVLMSARQFSLSDFHLLFNPSDFELNDYNVVKYINVALNEKCKKV